MLTFENLLSEETSKMTRSIGGWTAVSNATISHVVRFSPYTETLTSNVLGNSIKVTATGAGSAEVVTERFNVELETFYKGFEWVYGTAVPTTTCGIRFYSIDSVLLQDTDTDFTPMSSTAWNGVWHIAQTPENAVTAELYTTFGTVTAGQELFISRPSVMQQSKITTDFVDYALYHVPDYILEADLAQTGNDVGAPTPLVRYTVVASKTLSDTMDDIVSWDFIHPTFSDSGTPDYSSLVDPFKAEPEWLLWLAQLMGVSLDTVPSGGRSPWLAFLNAGIESWTDWEESVDLGSIAGVADTEWVDIESYSPDYFDTELARRLQISSGFNGVLGGTSESIISYVGALLNTDNEDPFVYVVKHYATNPYRILVAVLSIEDPDPSGDMLTVAVEAAAPAGTSVLRKHGVSVTARTYYSVPEMFYDMWTDIVKGGGLLPTRFVENNAANGRHIVLAEISGSDVPYLGGGVALARWHPGFAFYSGAMEVATDTLSAYNVLGDMEVRVLLSNVTIPTSGSMEIAASPNKWALSVDSGGNLVFEWEFGGTNTATSTLPVDWGSIDKGPFWVSANLDVNNDASGHDVIFYTTPSTYDEVWNQVGTTITTAGTSGVDSDGAASLTILGDSVSPEDGASGIVYRLMLLEDITRTSVPVADIDLTGEIEFAESLINTGASFFRLPVTNVRVDVNTAASGTAGLDETFWTAQAHKNGDDYFYLGKSPYKYDAGNTPGLGDTLVASSLPSDTYDWIITKLDGSQITGSTGTVTSITWDSDVYGGTSLLNVQVRESTGSTVQAFFSPELLEADLTVNTDAYGVDWTISRAWTTTEFYEYSGYVDRDHVSTTFGAGMFNSGITFDADETITVAVAVRRFWSGSGVTAIVDHTTTSGWTIRYNGDLIEALVTDGTSTVTLSYDEVAGGLLGTFSLVTLRRDVGVGTVSLWINDTEVDSVADPFVGAGLFPVTGSWGMVGSGSIGSGMATKNFDLRYFGIFDRSLPDEHIAYLSDEMASLALVLPQAAKAVVIPLITSTVVVHIPGMEWYNNIIVTSALDASPTLYEPSLNMNVVAGYVSTGNVVYEPIVFVAVHPPVLDAGAALYTHTITGGA